MEKLQIQTETLMCKNIGEKIKNKWKLYPKKALIDK